MGSVWKASADEDKGGLVTGWHMPDRGVCVKYEFAQYLIIRY